MLRSFVWSFVKGWLREQVTPALIEYYLAGLFTALRVAVQKTPGDGDDKVVDALERATDRKALAAEMAAWVHRVLDAV